MKLRRLFFALLALPLAFVACTEPDEPVVENKEYNLNVTSELVLSFEAEGGQGVITYELVEETPKSMRLRKIILNEIERKRKSSDFDC